MSILDFIPKAIKDKADSISDLRKKPNGGSSGGSYAPDKPSSYSAAISNSIGDAVGKFGDAVKDQFQTTVQTANDSTGRYDPGSTENGLKGYVDAVSDAAGGSIGDIASSMQPSRADSGEADGTRSEDGPEPEDGVSPYVKTASVLGGPIFGRIVDDLGLSERERDEEAYGNYLDYYNDRKSNENEYDDSNFDPDYLSKYLPWSSGKGEEIVDNGTNSYLNRTSHFITGAEAKKQAEYFGNQELSEALEGVADNKIISKDSLRQFGYTPFVDTSNTPTYIGSKMSQLLSDRGEDSERIWNKVSGLRNDLSDWDVNLFGEKFSGKSVDKAIAESRFKGAGSYDEEGNWLPANVGLYGEDAKERSDGLYDVPGEDGNTYVIDKSKLTIGEDGSVDFRKAYPLTYQDAVVKTKKGEEVSIPMRYWADVTKDPDVAEYLAGISNPDASYEDRKKEANKIYEDMGSAVYYGPLNLRAPSYLADSIFSEYAAPTMLNGALSSMAYFNPATLAERTALAEGLSASGVNAVSQNVDDNGIVSYMPTPNLSLNTAMGAIAPVAESRLGSLGNFGGKGFLEKGTEMISSRIPGIGSTWLGREFIPAATSEGLEEVVTDPLYAMQDSGLSAYADQAIAEDGLPEFDEYDRPVYENTGMGRRFGNFLKDQPDNFAMGAVLGGGMNLGSKIMQAPTKRGREESRSKRADRDFYNQHVRNTDSAFSRDEVSALRQQAASNSPIGDSIPLTMQQFEEMMRNINISDNLADEDTLDAQVKRNMR